MHVQGRKKVEISILKNLEKKMSTMSFKKRNSFVNSNARNKCILRI